MDADTSTLSSGDLAAENARLRARVEQLESELVEQARANAAVAAAQERAYWLDRWHLDLNALMRRPGSRGAARGAARWSAPCCAAPCAQAAPARR